MKELSKVVENAPKSKIRKLFDLAAGRTDVISLGIGQPDNPSPQSLIDGNIQALKDRKTVYAPTRGVPEFKQAVAKKVKCDNNIIADPEKNVIITNGGSQAITLAMAVTLNPGDEIIVSSPNFVSYFYCSQFFHSKAVEVKRKDNYEPDFEGIKKAITPKTKSIIACSPNNPTGYTYSKRNWEQMKDIVIDNDLYLISDECYEKFIYDDNKFISPASLDDMKDRTITLNAISKSFSAPGFRLGYVVANDNIIDLMEKYMQYTVAGTNHAAQYGAISAMNADQSFFNEVHKSYVERRDLVYNRLVEIGFEVAKPGGSFYIMPSVEKFGMTSDEFSMKLMKQKSVAVVPGDIFGSFSADKIRISYATEKGKLSEALNRIEDFIGSL
ncbi:MAG: aminotransferase class I/II-fold pyridoxal phosphate-dependent enzyme [archaeon]|nr:aminotransferase class I/II-fold pyridoxal phosphate-dependent enzyme [archaeon]